MSKRYQHDVLGEYKSALEAIAAIGSSAVMEPLSGYAGLAKLAMGGSLDDAVNRIDKVGSYTYEPEDKRVINGIGEIAAPVGEQVMKFKDWAGNNTLEATGSPGLASIASITPEIVGTILGLKGMPKTVGRPGQEMSPRFSRPDAPDMSRRDFTRKAATAGVALPLAAKALMSMPEAGTASKVAAPLASAINVPKVSPKQFSLVSLIRETPGMAEAIKKGDMEIHDDRVYVANMGADGVPSPTGHDYFANFELDVSKADLLDAAKLADADDVQLDLSSLSDKHYNQFGASVDDFKEILNDADMRVDKPYLDPDLDMNEIFVSEKKTNVPGRTYFKSDLDYPLFRAIWDTAGDFRIRPDELKPIMREFLKEYPNHPNRHLIQEYIDDPNLLQGIFSRNMKEENMGQGTIEGNWQFMED